MRTTTLRKTALSISAAAALLAPVAATAATTSAGSTTTASTSTAPYCGIYWGSLPKNATPLWTGPLERVRHGQHPCFDRLVVDVAPGAGQLGYTVRYVSTVRSPGSGEAVAVAGGARLQITVNAPATKRIPAGGTTTFTGWRTFRQLRWAGSFEGYTDFGLGVRARLPMRAFVLSDADGGRRLVVDVAHRW